MLRPYSYYQLHMTPAQMNDGASLIFSELVYEGLLRFTDNFGLQAGIAQSWKTSEEGRSSHLILIKKHDFIMVIL